MPNVVVDVSGPELSLPETGRDPLSPAVKLQSLAPVVLQLIVAAPFGGTSVGAAPSVSVRPGGGSTVTVTLFETLPPEPDVHVMPKVVVDVSGPELSLPDTGRAPLSPDVNVQSLAPVVLQLIVALPLTGTFPGVAPSVSVRAVVPSAPEAAKSSARCTLPGMPRLPRPMPTLPAANVASRL